MEHGAHSVSWELINLAFNSLNYIQPLNIKLEITLSLLLCFLDCAYYKRTHSITYLRSEEFWGNSGISGNGLNWRQTLSVNLTCKSEWISWGAYNASTTHCTCFKKPKFNEFTFFIENCRGGGYESCKNVFPTKVVRILCVGNTEISFCLN